MCPVHRDSTGVAVSQNFGRGTVNGVLVIKISQIFSIGLKIQLKKTKIEADLTCC